MPPKSSQIHFTTTHLCEKGNTQNGIDGWRLDVAFMVKHKFWKDWRKHVKSINPEAYIVAEIVDSIEVNKPYLLGDEFDAVMNYNFTFACAEYFINDKTRIKTTEFDILLKGRDCCS